MRKLGIGLSAAVMTALVCSVSVVAKDHVTTIHITKNYHPTSSINAECIASVATDPVAAVRGEKITWKVVNGNGQNTDDDCPTVDVGQVSLKFKDHVMGMAAMKKLTANPAGLIEGTVSMRSSEAKRGKHKYRIFYKGLAAGPDPEIDIDCPGCGPHP